MSGRARERRQASEVVEQEAVPEIETNTQPTQEEMEVEDVATEKKARVFTCKISLHCT